MLPSAISPPGRPVYSVPKAFGNYSVIITEFPKLNSGALDITPNRKAFGYGFPPPHHRERDVVPFSHPVLGLIPPKSSPFSVSFTAAETQSRWGSRCHETPLDPVLYTSHDSLPTNASPRRPLLTVSQIIPHLAISFPYICQGSAMTLELGQNPPQSGKKPHSDHRTLQNQPPLCSA